jgi:putative nucleotidyltransferase with HDIG domain
MNIVFTPQPRGGGSLRLVGEAKRASDELSSPLVALIASLAAIAGAGLFFAVPRALETAHAHPVGLGAFAAATIAFQLLAVRSYGVGGEAVSAIGILASGFVFGSATAMTIATLAAVVQWVSKRGLLHRAIFDAAGFSLSALAGTLVYELAGRVQLSGIDVFVGAVAAGVTYKLVNVGLLCAAMSIAESRPAREIWLERFHWARYYYLAFGPLALGSAVAYDALGLIGFIAFSTPPMLVSLSVRQYVDRTRESFERIQHANEQLKAAHADLAASHEQVRRTHLATIAALSRAIEAKDVYTGGHIERVSTLAVALAERLGITGDDLEAVEVGALLHDIGKIGMPEAVLQKPGPLDDAEWSLIKQHPVISEQILKGLDLHPYVRQIARSSHERLDGTGYPDALVADEIPLPARIVLVADAFDALTSDRPYRRAQTLSSALEEIRANAGTQFCPRVVAALEDVARTAPRLLAAPQASALAS